MPRRLHFGPARVPARDSPEAAVAALLAGGYSACEIDFEGRFWMDYPFAETFGALCREHDIALSVHAPIAGFMGHAERGKKLNMAIGMLDHSAGIAVAAGAELVVFHPGFLLGRTREDAIDAVCDQLDELRVRLEGKGRAVPFGIEVMGRVRDLGSLDDVVEIASRVHWVRPVLDFAHMHATSDGEFTTVDRFAEALEQADSVLERGAPFHIHFSDIQFANRNETKHLPYGEGTLRAEPLRDALATFDRPATVISESPDTDSTEAIRSILCRFGRRGAPARARRHRQRLAAVLEDEPTAVCDDGREDDADVRRPRGVVVGDVLDHREEDDQAAEDERDQALGEILGQLDAEETPADERDDRDREEKQEDAPEAVDAAPAERDRTEVVGLPVQEQVDEQQNAGAENEFLAE